jgi:hypothetical protein
MKTFEDLLVAINDELTLVNNQTPYVMEMIKTEQGKEDVVQFILELIMEGNSISQSIVIIDNVYDINNPDNG